MQLAELNIAHPRYELDDPRIADFMNNLDRINALAERSPGFVWRLAGDGGNATDLAVPGAPGAILNVSVWQSAEDLERFVWNKVHARFYNRKGEWFAPLREAYFVMWHVADGHRPTAAEALERLHHLRRQGSSDFAFGWDALPSLKAWRDAQCG